KTVASKIAGWKSHPKASVTPHNMLALKTTECVWACWFNKKFFSPDGDSHRALNTEKKESISAKG
ncbi:MAG: hypothetical protein ACRCYD_01695, partial [Plesiomonas sp.]